MSAWRKLPRAVARHGTSRCSGRKFLCPFGAASVLIFSRGLRPGLHSFVAPRFVSCSAGSVPSAEADSVPGSILSRHCRAALSCRAARGYGVIAVVIHSGNSADCGEMGVSPVQLKISANQSVVPPGLWRGTRCPRTAVPSFRSGQVLGYAGQPLRSLRQFSTFPRL